MSELIELKLVTEDEAECLNRLQVEQVIVICTKNAALLELARR